MDRYGNTSPNTVGTTWNGNKVSDYGKKSLTQKSVSLLFKAAEGIFSGLRYIAAEIRNDAQHARGYKKPVIHYDSDYMRTLAQNKSRAVSFDLRKVVNTVAVASLFTAMVGMVGGLNTLNTTGTVQILTAPHGWIDTGVETTKEITGSFIHWAENLGPRFEKWEEHTPTTKITKHLKSPTRQGSIERQPCIEDGVTEYPYVGNLSKRFDNDVDKAIQSGSFMELFRIYKAAASFFPEIKETTFFVLSLIESSLGTNEKAGNNFLQNDPRAFDHQLYKYRNKILKIITSSDKLVVAGKNYRAPWSGHKLSPVNELIQTIAALETCDGLPAKGSAAAVKVLNIKQNYPFFTAIVTGLHIQKTLNELLPQIQRQYPDADLSGIESGLVRAIHNMGDRGAKEIVNDLKQKAGPLVADNQKGLYGLDAAPQQTCLEVLVNASRYVDTGLVALQAKIAKAKNNMSAFLDSAIKEKIKRITPQEIKIIKATRQQHPASARPQRG